MLLSEIPRFAIAFDSRLSLPRHRIVSRNCFFGSFEVGNQLNCLSTPEKPAHALPFPTSSSFFYSHTCSSLPFSLVGIIVIYLAFLRENPSVYVFYLPSFPRDIILHFSGRKIKYIFSWLNIISTMPDSLRNQKSHSLS